MKTKRKLLKFNKFRLVRRTEASVGMVLAVKLLLPKEEKLSTKVYFNVSLKFKDEIVGSTIKRVRDDIIEWKFEIDSKMMKLPASLYLCIETKKKRMIWWKSPTIAEAQSYSLANLKKESEIKKALKVNKSRVEIFARFKKDEDAEVDTNSKNDNSVKVLTVLDEREPFHLSPLF